jgi:hypothetical protein
MDRPGRRTPAVGVLLLALAHHPSVLSPRPRSHARQAHHIRIGLPGRSSIGARPHGSRRSTQPH